MPSLWSWRISVDFVIDNTQKKKLFLRPDIRVHREGVIAMIVRAQYERRRLLFCSVSVSHPGGGVREIPGSLPANPVPSQVHRLLPEHHFLMYSVIALLNCLNNNPRSYFLISYFLWSRRLAVWAATEQEFEDNFKIRIWLKVALSFNSVSWLCPLKLKVQIQPVLYHSSILFWCAAGCVAREKRSCSSSIVSLPSSSPVSSTYPSSSPSTRYRLQSKVHFNSISNVINENLYLGVRRSLRGDV